MKVDFYVIDNANYQQSLLTICQLIEKAYHQQQSIYVHASSAEEASRLDDLLWTFRDDSFLPHSLYDQSDEFPASIQIGCGEIVPKHQLLINLSKEIPGFYQQFEQLIEIVFSDPTVQQLARERYRQYREQGNDITTHKIKANTL